MSKAVKKSVMWRVMVLAAGLLAYPGSLRAETYILPSSAFRVGTNGAEYRTDVRLLNQGTSAVTVTASFYDQVTSAMVNASPFPVAARNQAAYDNVLESLFGRTLSQGAYGPIRFETTGPILVTSSVNNVNACGTGAVSGQWLPGIVASQALTAGVIGQLAVSATAGSGYRTNLVFMNPGSTAATVTVRVRRGGGALLSTGTIGPLSANGFSQVPLDSAAVFPGITGTTDTNLWLEFTSDQPVLAYATIIHNASGDPFAVVASVDTATPAVSFSGTWSGNYILSSCTQTGDFASAGFCGMTPVGTSMPISLSLTQTGNSVRGTLAQGAVYSSVSGTVDGAGHLKLTGSGSSSGFNVQTSAWDTTQSSGRMSGTFTSRFTSSSFSGYAQWGNTLGTVTKTSSATPPPYAAREGSEPGEDLQGLVEKLGQQPE